MPNDLLEVIGSNRFRVDEADLLVSRQFASEPVAEDSANRFGTLLTVITTNEERDLPAAFVRRCVVHTITEPDTPEQRSERLVNVALLHMKLLIMAHDTGLAMVKQIADKCIQLREDAKKKQRRGPSIAEFLDAVRFCVPRGISPDDEEWKAVQQSVLLK